MSLNNVAEDIVTRLDAATIFGTAGTDIFAFEWGTGLNGKEVDKQIMVTDTGAIQTDEKDTAENPTFLIQVRGNNREPSKVVHDRARQLYEFLLQEVRQTINGIEYLPFAPIGNGIVPMGYDSNNRAIYSMTFFTFRVPIGDSVNI